MGWRLRRKIKHLLYALIVLMISACSQNSQKFIPKEGVVISAYFGDVDLPSRQVKMFGKVPITTQTTTTLIDAPILVVKSPDGKEERFVVGGHKSFAYFDAARNHKNYPFSPDSIGLKHVIHLPMHDDSK